MTTSTSTKHMVWVEKPIGTRIGVAYSTLKEAQQQIVALERDGYKIIEIVEATLPKPNVV
jgi:carboxypeptidase C (cathepsin A)